MQFAILWIENLIILREWKKNIWLIEEAEVVGLNDCQLKTSSIHVYQSVENKYNKSGHKNVEPSDWREN